MKKNDSTTSDYALNVVHQNVRIVIINNLSALPFHTPTHGSSQKDQT
jgi:hypothetical protein